MFTSRIEERSESFTGQPPLNTVCQQYLRQYWIEKAVPSALRSNLTTINTIKKLPADTHVMVLLYGSSHEMRQSFVNRIIKASEPGSSHNLDLSVIESDQSTGCYPEEEINFVNYVGEIELLESYQEMINLTQGLSLNHSPKECTRRSSRSTRFSRDWACFEVEVSTNRHIEGHVAQTVEIGDNSVINAPNRNETERSYSIRSMISQYSRYTSIYSFGRGQYSKPYYILAIVLPDSENENLHDRCLSSRFVPSQYPRLNEGIDGIVHCYNQEDLNRICDILLQG